MKEPAGKLVDLSHTIEDGLVTYKGLPAPIICDFLSREDSRKFYSEGTEFHIGKIEMVSNTGTYLDSPFHRYADGDDLSQLDLERVANLEAVRISAEGFFGQAVDVSLFENIDLRGKAVLIQTGWDKNWNTEDYYLGHPFLTGDAAQFLVDSGAKLVGIDSYNIDDIENKSRPVHSILLKAGILIVEHMTNLKSLPDRDFKFFAVPVKVSKFGTFPVRAFAVV